MKAIESWLIRRTLCRLTTKNYNLLFLALLDRIREDPAAAGDVAVAYLRGLTSESRYWPNDDEVVYQILTLPIFRLLSRGRLRMVLEALEDDLRTPQAEDSRVPRGLPIEHVLPYAWTDHWPLPPEVEPLEAASVRDTAKQTLGNLTLVTTKLNSEMSNAAWQKKMTALSKHTTLFLNKAIVDDNPDGWDETSIQSRGERLAQRAIAIWPGPDDEGWGENVPQIATSIAAQRELGVQPIRESVQLVTNGAHATGRRDDDLKAENHEYIRERTDSEFLLDSMDSLESWLAERGFTVLHRKGGHHTVYRGRMWIGGYYFAKRWLHFWLQNPIAADEAFATLSHSSTNKKGPRQVSGNVHDPPDLDILKKAFQARV